MYLIVHAPVGVAIAVVTNNIWLTIILATASHFILDRIVHWQYAKGSRNYSSKAAISVLIGLALTVLFIVTLTNLKSKPERALMVIGAVSACLPDFDDFLSFIIPEKSTNFLSKSIIRLFYRYQKWHIALQNETKKPIGIITQVCIVIIAVVIIFIT